MSSDFEEKVKLATIFYNMKENESAKYRKLVHYDVLSSNEHERVYTRIFLDEIQALIADESLLFQNTHFSIEPIKGKLWPNKATELTITFCPKEIGEFQTTAYLDIDGFVDRVPLNLVGISMPPSIHLNVETLDMDNVYINKSYNYEGPFFEEINFTIRDTDVVLKLYLKGEVIYPSLTFSIPCLDFGEVSVGVPKTMQLDVINESAVDINGTLKISSDGPEISSITLVDYAVADHPKPVVPQWPREFHIEPSKVDIESESRISIRVTLTANLIRANQTSLELELENSDSPPIVLPVLFNAMVPTITPAPEINLRACFLNYSYHNEIVVNSNNFRGYFTLEKSQDTTLELYFQTKEGFIEPNSTLTLPISIRTSVLGVQENGVMMNLFGQTKPFEICHITGCGVRPIVTCNPLALHWGQIKLLTKSQKCLTLCNDSPVDVNFTAALLNKDGKWQISPTEGSVEPESEIDLTLTLYLIDADSYTNKAVIHLDKVKDIVILFSNSRAFFNLEPRSFKISAGEKFELSVTGISHKVTKIKEMWYLVGSVEGINKKELLIECEVMAEFVDPKIEISSPVVEFQYDFGPYSELYKLTDIVTIKNVSKLPLDIDISVKPPFAIVQKQSTYKIPCEEASYCCCIRYRKSDLNLQTLLNKMGPRESRTFIDFLTAKPVEPLRKGSLQFFQDIHKIKTAFNLTHTVEERLEDQEIMKIQILFDTTKHLNLKSRVYCDLMKIRFRGHKNKDAIKLVGKINFPNVFILPPRLDFQCILNGSIQSKTIKIQNTTPVMVCYQFQWKKCFITKISPPPLPMEYAICNSPAQVISEDVGTTGTCIRDVLNIPTSNEDAEEESVNEFGETLTGEIETAATYGESVIDTQDLRTRIIRKVAPMLDGDYDTEFEWIHKFPRLRKLSPKININNVFQLVSHRGLLKPSEIQFVHVIFRPTQNIGVRAVLECEVLGGPSETIVVTGQSSDLMYQISSETVNFKIRSFHENAVEGLKIRNTANLTFECKTYLFEKKCSSDLEANVLEVIPSEKVLGPKEEIELKVVIRPGVVGYFRREFLLEIGHLPLMPIEIRPEIGYEAIPKLTQLYLDCINEIFHKGKDEHLNSPLTEKCFEDPEFQTDWHICTAWDGYPSTMDIDLVIEKLLIVEYIKLHPEIMHAYTSAHPKVAPIQGYSTIPYVIDFGVVITGSTVQCTADVINYGPIALKLYFSKGTIVPQWLTMKLTGRLLPGETGKLEVAFAPTSEDFMELEQNVETSFNIEVAYGVTIPIQMKALCAVPYLVTNVKIIDFGSVRCGDKIIYSIPLKNVGRPTCIWYATLKLKAVGPSPMSVLNSSGNYEPGAGGWLSVAFKPTMEMMYEGYLIFRFHMNPQKMTIPVTGQGIVPRVHIIGPNVNFPPTLPWAETTDMYFGLTNPCPFPIELIVAHSDEKWKEEEDIYHLLYKYYDKPEEMLVPVIKPGMGLPQEVVDFYYKFHEGIKRAKEEELAFSNKMLTSKVTTTAKKPKSPKEKLLQKQHSAPPKDTPISPMKIRTEFEIIAEMQCQEMAYTVGKRLGIPTINVDYSIVQALCETDIPAKELVVAAVEENYEMLKRNTKSESDTGAEHCEDEFDEDKDEFEVLLKKIKFLANQKNVPTPRSKQSDKKKKKSSNSSITSHSALGAMGSTTLFQMSIRNLHLVLCHADFSKWAQTYEETQRENETVVDETHSKIYDETEIEEIVTSFDDMDADEYENTPAELKSLYIMWGLEARRRKYCERKGVDFRIPGEINQKKEKSKEARSSTSVHIDANETKKKVKKDDPKGTYAIVLISSYNGKQATEYLMMNAKYNDYNKLTYEQLINTANNWIIEECDVGQPLLTFTGQMVGATLKKAKKKSEIQLHNQIKKCECNQLTDLNLLDDSNQENVLNILSKWHCTCGKKLTSSQTSTSEIPSLSVDKIPHEASEEDLELQPLPLRRVKTIKAPANRLILQPGDLVRCKYSFSPQEEGNYSVKRFVEVSGWPKSRVDINVSGICDLPSGVWPVVAILPLTKVIDYGRLLLYRREDDRFIVKNDSVLPIMWKIRNAQDFVEDFIIAETSGIVPRNDNQVVPITYIACRVGVITMKVLTIDIYDSLGRGDPILMDNLSLSAECYDVMVECAHENPSENFLNYGNVKVNSTVVREMYFLNRGKYNIYYKLKKVKNFPEPSLLRSFEAIPEYGVIPATLKLVAIEFECTPTTSMNLVNVPAYTCSLLDGSKEQVVVAKFPVCVTIASFYNTFTLFPLGELNFHIIPVGTGITREVILNNTSKCPVTYEIILPSEYQLETGLVAPSAKGKDTRIRNPPLKCGNFVIMNEDNLLPPGTSRTIQIQFFATAARQFEETINFIISDTCPAEANGVPLRLVGTGAMPTLDLWNLETTFREHLIVKNLSEYKVPESSPHCVFAENSVTLHFFCVTVNSSHTGAIDLYNNGLVACALSMKLHHQSNSNPTIFSLDKFETHIEPLLHKNLGIIFSPKALQEYRAVLEIKLKLLDNQEQSFKICLIGEGVIPRIELLSPRLRHQRTAVLQFSVTCLGSVSSKPISFKNITSVNSVTVLEVLQTMNEVRPIFWLAAAPESEHVVTSSTNEEINLKMKVTLRPAQKTTLNAYFSPIAKGKTCCEIRITIEENPYEYFTVICEGESFMEDVILMGLEMLSMDMDLDTYKMSVEDTMSTLSTADKRSKTASLVEKKKSRTTQGVEPRKTKRLSSASIRRSDFPAFTESSLLKYVLDFGGCELCSLQRRSVVMVNNSEKVYKFCWSEVECIVIKPSMGYISPGEEKDLEINFFAAQPVSIHKTRNFEFKVENVGQVPMKIIWSFQIDDEFPARVDKQEIMNSQINSEGTTDEDEPSNVTLFSNSMGRESVDTWFEVDLPFSIEPVKDCLKPGQSRVFKVTFAPLDAFDFKVRLKSTIDNLDPYDQNISCKLTARSVIPYVHLDIEESDYVTSGRRKITGVALPPYLTVLEFNVLGSGCYKKTFNVINPTSEAYEFIFEMVMSDKPELIPVHCNSLKGYVEGGTSSEVTFTFSPTAPGDYESIWKFLIPVYNLVMNILVVGIVREPEVIFVPTILIIRNSLVGFTTTNVVMLKNNETEELNFEFKGNSLCNESGKTPVICEPNCGVLKPRSETPINIIYTPIQDGPLSFKIYCNVTYLTKYLTLCVNALSYSIKPKVTYYLIGNELVLNCDALTNIHLEQTASTYERTIPFVIKNDGSATFFFEWSYNVTYVKKYMQLSIEPKCGHVTPGKEIECTLYFTIKQIPVQSFPVTLSISDGPEYKIFIHAEIEKPLYHFSCMDFNFSKCFINAPDFTYRKNIALINDDKVPIIVALNFTNIPELVVEYDDVSSIKPGKRLKIAIDFRPKQVKEYVFTLQFFVNSLCEEIVTIRGEGIPLLFDLYEGCQKSFDLGYVKVGEKLVRTIEVMNHSKVAIEASYIFREMYPEVDDSAKSDTTSFLHTFSRLLRVQMLQTYENDKVRNQIAKDIQNALSSLKVIPNKCTILPYKKVPLKIQFKPVGMISTLNVQLNMKVFQFERPLVRLSGCATGMSFCFSQNSLQFGRVRKRGCKILKVMLQNKGDFGARFWWQPLISNEFTISPQYGTIAAHTNVTFTITFRPVNHNPFIKVWASCNIENYKPLELALYATCVDLGNVQNKTLNMECPVREIHTDYVVVTNPTDDLWFVLSETSGGPFETWKEFHVEPNSTQEIPISFKPKTLGKHEFPETYVASTELVKVIPDKFGGHYEIKCAETIKTWGEAAATCRWTFVCYEECEMTLKVVFVNQASREYQFYIINVLVTESLIVDTLKFVCRAREMAQNELVIKNPLAEDAEFTVHCEKLQCPDTLKINRNSEAVLSMTYSPLVVGELEDYLKVSNFIVGTYVYKTILKCLPAKEKNLEYETSLGTNIPIRLKVQNRSDVKTEFFCKVSHPSIQAEREYTLGPLEKGKFLVWFEPTELGVQHCRISFDSDVAGEFIFNIKGTGTDPKPSGPYEIKAGSSTIIKFKNIFDDTRMFKIYVDRDEFYVKTLYEPIRPKKEMKIQVSLNDRPVSGWSVIPTGTLTIENCEPPTPKVHWTYFLQGIP
ncbi:hypothetical protein HF086_013936 [Spodoptera exigua]|uniref:Hydrocephalus inducing n=1 Tax=Spodoptera exigua TaxID=7107 RepID=A0A922MLQ0_SPOEX|nr:hypothetical protein HF086_013936 [Spodoptera exigua]